MITTASVLARARKQLHDPAKRRWSDEDLLDYLNEGQRQIVIYRPDANAVLFEHSLQSGATQQLPDGYIALVEVLCNFSGGVEGAAVTEVSRADLDGADVNWRASTPSPQAVHFVRGNMTPADFYVYPPNDGTGIVRASASKEPEPTTLSGNLSLRSSFEAPLMHFICYRCLEEDRESEPSAQLAAYHEQQYLKMLGVATQQGA